MTSVASFADPDIRWGSVVVEPREAAERQTARRAGVLVLILVVGYLVAGRSFAYIGISQANVFIGEVVLVVLVLYPRTRAALSYPSRSLTGGGPLSLLATLTAALVGLGVLELVRGILSGFSLAYALRNLPFDYYPLFLFVGIWVAGSQPRLLSRVTWILAIVNGIYGPIYVVLLSHLSYTLPGDNAVALFGNGTGSAIAIVGLLSYHRAHRLTPVVAALNTFTLLGNQVRSEWSALILGLVIWCVASRQIRLLIQSAVCAVLALVALSLSGITIPGANGRGGTVSLGGIFGRLIASVDPALAAKFTQNSDVYAGTVSWRTQWWHDILVSSASSPDLRILGHGYGFPLFSLTTYVPPDTRTPHSVFFYALGYTGWLGVVLLAVFWAVILTLLIKQGLRSADWFGVAVFAMALVIGLFGDWFETPYGAIPTYLLVGLALAPLLGSAFAPPERLALPVTEAKPVSAPVARALRPRGFSAGSASH